MTSPAAAPQSIAGPHPAGNRYAQVAMNLPVKEPFTYSVPGHLEVSVQVGMRVLVPFGKRRLTGYVVAFTDEPDPSLTLKDIEEVLDSAPVLSGEILTLTRWLAEYYQSSWGEAIKATLPAGMEEESQELLTLSDKGALALENEQLRDAQFWILESVRKRKSMTAGQLKRLLQNRFSPHAMTRLKQEGLLTATSRIRKSTVPYQYEKQARLKPPVLTAEEIETLFKRSPKQKELYQLLKNGAHSLKELSAKLPTTSNLLGKLKDKELVEVSVVKRPREAGVSPIASVPAQEAPIRFNSDQQRVYDELNQAIEDARFCAYLLHGITGSGKTEIYIRCIEAALKRGKTAIMMVPEISLTPQTVSRFLSRFGENVAILHSGLSQRERYQEWKKIHDGRVAIVVGARSAVFAPFKNLGVIVIDEEHDASYKQDSTPRYHARDTAIVRARAAGAVVILGSATPSLESLGNVDNGKYRLLSLNKRVGDRLLPLVRVVDMKKEKDERKNFSILSCELRAAMGHRLERGEQVFLFLNRRGTANYVFCKECGFVFECPQCSVTLTFHGSELRMRCHYCNWTARVPAACPDCKGELLRFSGFGTQKLEEETCRLFPQARIVRIDRDTARGRADFESMHARMNSGEIDILIGTQMITKGHDFPNVTLVGVVHADLSLNIPDFRSSERSFQLLTQVSGRAGRGSVPGQVIVQTHNPGHYVFEFVRNHDPAGFYTSELELRKKLNYPPFTRMAALEIESGREPDGEKLAGRLKTHLLRSAPQKSGVEVLGPSRAALYRIKNKFRWHILLRAASARGLMDVLTRIPAQTELKPLLTRGTKLSIDVDPVNLL